MSDLIDRQAAINSLHMHLMYRMGTDSNKKRLDDWINNLPSAQTEQRWISVSERLPEEYKRVLVSDVFGVYVGEFVDAEENWGGKHFIDTHGIHSISVKAWQPLPEPYREEGEE